MMFVRQFCCGNRLILVHYCFKMLSFESICADDVFGTAVS